MEFKRKQVKIAKRRKVLNEFVEVFWDTANRLYYICPLDIKFSRVFNKHYFEVETFKYHFR